MTTYRSQKTRHHFSANKGFTLIELIIAISLLSFGMVGAYGAMSGIFSSIYNSSSKLVAIYLAREGMEITKNIRDNNFLNERNFKNGLTGCGNGCQADYKAGTPQESSVNKLRP